MATGKPRNRYLEMKFLVEIDGVESARFTDCGEIKGTKDFSEYSEGGELTPENIPAGVKFADVTLTRGASENKDMWNLSKNSANSASRKGSTETFAATIVQLGYDDEREEEFVLKECQVADWSSGKWDNKSSEVRMESMTLKFRYPEWKD